MRGTARPWSWLFALCLVVASALATAAPSPGLVPVPPLQARLTDLTGTLTSEQTASLEQKLKAFEVRKGTQIAVLMVPTTQPEAIEQYAIRVAEQWKLGRQKVDDGALLLIAKNDRAIRIEVGYGLEGALTDATSRRIIGEVITPPLQAGDYFAGISAGVDQLIRVADGEPLPEPKPGATDLGGHDIGRLLPVFFFLALALGSVLRSVLGRLPGALVTGGLLALGGWFVGAAITAAAIGGAIAFVVTLLGMGMGRHGGLYGLGMAGMGGLGGGGSGGGGFSGGGGGGGFSGGGGGFGGGGASGRF